VRKDLADSRAAIQDADRLFAAAQTGQLTDTSASLTQLRSAQASAMERRTQAEAGLIAAVSSELTARATDLLALLQHDMQAAEFGTATAAFFNAIDQGRPAGTTTRTQGSSGGGAAANLTPTPSGRAPASTTTNAPSGTAAANKSTLAARAGTPPTQKK